MSDKKIKMAVLLSGSGRSLQNFIDLSLAGELQADIAGVISSRPGVKALERALDGDIPARVVDRRDFEDAAGFSRAITSVLSGFQPELVAMAGFLSLYVIPPEFENKVMNIHPALLPAFGGKGYYGERVHKAVLDYGCKVSGCTVHFANNQYDHGPIILQECVRVAESDDARSLAARVFKKEKLLYPRAVNLFAENRLIVNGRRVKIKDATF